MTSYSILLRREGGEAFALHRTTKPLLDVIRLYAEDGYQVVHLLPIPNFKEAPV